MKKTILDSKLLEGRFDCFGQYDSDDIICRNWCQLNIRCVIAQQQGQELEIIDEFLHFATETSRIQ